MKGPELIVGGEGEGERGARNERTGCRLGASLRLRIYVFGQVFTGT